MPAENTIRFSKVNIYGPEIKPKIKAAEENRMDWCLAMISSNMPGLSRSGPRVKPFFLKIILKGAIE